MELLLSFSLLLLGYSIAINSCFRFTFSFCLFIVFCTLEMVIWKNENVFVCESVFVSLFFSFFLFDCVFEGALFPFAGYKWVISFVFLYFVIFLI